MHLCCNEYLSSFAVRPNITSITSSVSSSENLTLFHRGMLSLEEFTPGIKLTCEAYGFPPPMVVWLKDGVALQNLTGRRVITTNGGPLNELGNITQSILRLTEVQLSDAGEYTCRASSGTVSPIPGTTAWTFTFEVTGEILGSLTVLVKALKQELLCKLIIYMHMQ